MAWTLQVLQLFRYYPFQSDVTDITNTSATQLRLYYLVDTSLGWRLLAAYAHFTMNTSTLLETPGSELFQHGHQPSAGDSWQTKHVVPGLGSTLITSGCCNTRQGAATTVAADQRNCIRNWLPAMLLFTFIRCHTNTSAFQIIISHLFNQLVYTISY